MEYFLAKKYTGPRVSGSGLLGRIKEGCRVNDHQRFALGELNKHLHEMAERFYLGDIKAVDKFLQMYCLDGFWPTQKVDL